MDMEATADARSAPLDATAMEADIDVGSIMDGGTIVESDAAPLPMWPSPPAYLGGDRPARYYRPLNHNPEVPAPLMILLHGFSSSGTGTDYYFQLSDQTRENGIILVVPEGRENRDGYRFWAATDYCCDYYGDGDVDVDYIKGLIEEAAEYFAIDRTRVSLVGHSNGGFMSYRMACDASNSITSLVSLAGTSWADPADCSHTAPVSVLQVHGTWDGDIRYAGRRAVAGDPMAPWNFDACQTMSCADPVTACAEREGCTRIWDCCNECGWGDRDLDCRIACYDAELVGDQIAWMQEFTCVLNAGCYDNPAESSSGYSGALETVERWVERNGCQGDPEAPEPHDLDRVLFGADTSRLEWSDCSRGTGAALWTIVNGAHSPQFSSNFGARVIEWVLENGRRAEE